MKQIFKEGDKVRIKEGISSETHDWDGECFDGISFTKEMDEYVGRDLAIDKVYDDGFVSIDGCYLYYFRVEWLELASLRFTVDEIMAAAKTGEISEIDARHICNILEGKIKFED